MLYIAFKEQDNSYCTVPLSLTNKFIVKCIILILLYIAFKSYPLQLDTQCFKKYKQPIIF